MKRLNRGYFRNKFLVVAIAFFFISPFFYNTFTISIDYNLKKQPFDPHIEDLPDFVKGSPRLNFSCGPESVGGPRMFHIYLRWLTMFGENRGRPIPISNEELNTEYIEPYLFEYNNATLLSEKDPYSACHILYIMEKVDRLSELNTTLIANHIKDGQMEDGGIKSTRYHPPELGNYSDLESTVFAVQALAMIGEEPRNKTAMRDYIYSLQDTSSTYPNRIYEFKPYHTTVYWSEQPPEPIFTLWAALALTTLGYPLPYRSSIENRIYEKMTDFFALYDTYMEDDKVLFMRFFSESAYMFSLSEAQAIRDQLFPYAMGLHKSLPINNECLNGDFSSVCGAFAQLLTSLGKANPQLDFTLAPSKFNGSIDKHNFTLRIENHWQLWHNLTDIQVEIIGEGKDVFNINYPSITNITLYDRDYYEFNISLNQITANYTEDIDLKLSFIIPMKNLLTFADGVYNCDIYFNLTNSFSPEIPTPPFVSPTNVSDVGIFCFLIVILSLIGLWRKREKSIQAHASF